MQTTLQPFAAAAAVATHNAWQLNASFIVYKAPQSPEPVCIRKLQRLCNFGDMWTLQICESSEAM